ncbi:sugar phosphate nucleotidyltransferase [bacterium]|nr:sugar phosphate nucleotidyltransferase [bacterium]
MQGIVILGGKGTRLNLFSRRVGNKACALVYDRLVFEYPLNTLVRAGITDITLVLGYRYAGNLMNVVGDGKEFGIERLTYVYQREARGISDAILQAKNSVTDKCAVILGDNFFEMDITNHVEYFNKQEKGCALFTKKVHDPERYGVAELKNTGNIGPGVVSNDIDNIVEKPKNPKSNQAVTGLYFYDKTVFEKIDTLEFSKRGELEVTDLNMLYVKEGTAKAYEVEGYWNDMGTFDSILETSSFVKDNNFSLTYNIDAWEK